MRGTWEGRARVGARRGSSTLGLFLLAAGLAGAAPARIEPESTLPCLDPNAAAFPASDLVDFSPTLDAPAGKHGFLFAGTDGRFYFEDGQRGRFWGLNVAKDAVFVPKKTIDQAADCIAAAGFNLVRLHHVDGPTGLLPVERAGTAERIDPQKLDLLFYWVQALKQRGIYVYLDLLDFRTFEEAEGVPDAAKLDRAAKPAAVFNDRLIELQVQYAKDLLFGRVNPYTNLALGADPAVAMVEICDENGLFARQAKLADLPPGYHDELERRWDFWLRSAYGATDALRQAWTGADGRPALAAPERLEDNSVRLLPPREPDTDFPSPTGRAETNNGREARDRDVARFFYSVHREYFEAVKSPLRAAGLRAPLTAVTEWANPADLRSVADSLDFIGCNWYYDHPIFPAGRAWHLPSFFYNFNPVADPSALDFTSATLRASVLGKPLVVREWGVCWPNKFRGSGLLETAAYAALQDVDALILFTYTTDPDNRHIEYFDVSSDPPRWGLCGIAGALFRSRAIAPARKRALIALPKDEAFSLQATPLSSLFRLGWVSRLRQLLFEDTCASAGYDLVVAAGRQAPVAYLGPRVLLPADGSAGSVEVLRLSGYPLAVQPAPRGRFVFDGFIYNPAEAVSLGPGPRLSVGEVQGAGYEAIGINDDGSLAAALWDPQRQSAVRTPMGEEADFRTALDVLAGPQPDGAPHAHEAVTKQLFVSDTGQITRLVKEERLLLDAPDVQAVAGAFGKETMRTSALAVTSPSSLGAVVALSLDGKPLPESETFLLKMVTLATNTGEKKGSREAPPGSPTLKLEDFGDAPVLTHGQSSEAPLSVDLAGRPLLRAFLVNGTWEAVRKGRGFYLWCDTPGVRFQLPGLGPKVQFVPFGPSGPGMAADSAQPFVYPKGCLFLRVLPLE